MCAVMQVVVLAAVVTIVAGIGASAAPGENIALGKPYVIEPDPNYPSMSTPEADWSHVLTDGELIYGPRMPWVMLGTLGWMRPHTWIAVTIDLGQVEAIDQIRMHSFKTDQPNAQKYTDHVNFAVSEDGREYRVVADVHEASPDTDVPTGEGYPGALFAWFETRPDLAARGRYVRVTFAKPSALFFVWFDEVEVIAGDAGQAAREYRERFVFEGLSPSDYQSDWWGLLRRREAPRLLRAVLDDLDCALVQGVTEAGQKQTLEAEVETWRARLEQLPSQYPSDEDIDNISAQLEALRVRVLRGLFEKPLVAEAMPPYEEFSAKDVPDSGNGSVALRVLMAQNEREPAALLVTNTTGEPLNVTVRAVGGNLPGERLSLMTTWFQELRSGKTVADALLPITDGQFEIPAARSTMLYLLVDGRGLAAGEYGHRTILEAAGTSIPVQVNVQVSDVMLPDEPDLYLYNWSYLSEEFPILGTMDEEALAADLRDHYINTFIFGFCQRWATFDEDGNVTDFDFTIHDRWLKLHRNGRSFFMWFWLFDSMPNFRESFGRMEDGSPAYFEYKSPLWHTGLKNWVRAWVDHLEELGIGFDDFAFIPTDEQHVAEMEDTAYIRNVVKEVDPRIRIYANPYSHARLTPQGERELLVTDQHIRELAIPNCDILCPILGMEEDWPSMFDAPGQNTWLWNYTVHSKGNAPVEYRKQLWHTLNYGYEGTGFWAYGSISGSAWDDFDGGYGDYGVIYEHEDGPITSRRWEAWREGVEDYMLMRLAQEQGLDLTDDLAELLEDPDRIGELRQKWLDRLTRH